jgi:hypothetical protein
MANVIKLIPVVGAVAGVPFDVAGSWTPETIPAPRMRFADEFVGVGSVVPVAVPGAPQAFILRHSASLAGTHEIAVGDGTGDAVKISVVVAPAPVVTSKAPTATTKA